VPAAAVIPAPIAYIKVVAVKKLVVGSEDWSGGYTSCVTLRSCLHSRWMPLVLFIACFRCPARLL
jgi:TRAP-type uncharacterized transport system fused permease subunit